MNQSVERVWRVNIIVSGLISVKPCDWTPSSESPALCDFCDSGVCGYNSGVIFVELQVKWTLSLQEPPTPTPKL